METNIVPSSSENDPLQLMEVETHHLRKTIQALRNKLEHHQYEKDAAVQQAVQRSVDEIEQLKATSSSLRDELESMR
ncbi:MAG: hypothetical protein CMM67_10105, partial [Rhodospirillaceae bacterium]